ncbi:MAG: DUF1616 domain-containing protein [Thermoplasmata archaeon]
MEFGPVEVLRIIFGLLLIFFLPGYLLVKSLFPGRNELDKEYNIIYEIGLGMGLSIVIAILVGFFLGSLHQLIGFRYVDGKEKGYFDTPYIVASLLLICLLLFVAAWYRGAFPWMGKLHPALARVPASEKPEARKKRMDALILKLWDLSKERERLRREVRLCERRYRSHGRGMREHYKKKLEEARERLAKVDAEMRELEEQRAQELAGVEDEKGEAEEGERSAPGGGARGDTTEGRRGRWLPWLGARKERKREEGARPGGGEGTPDGKAAGAAARPGGMEEGAASEAGGAAPPAAEEE